MFNPKYETVSAHDGIEVQMATLEPKDTPMGVIRFIHGFGEGIAHYLEIAVYFASHGYACVIHDQRGFGAMPGLSPKQKQAARGINPGYNYFLEDVKTVRNMINKHFPGLPLILYGHSMGGNIAANFLIKNPAGIYSKAILEAPWFRLYESLPNRRHCWQG